MHAVVSVVISGGDGYNNHVTALGLTSSIRRAFVSAVNIDCYAFYIMSGINVLTTEKMVAFYVKSYSNGNLVES